VVTGLLAAVRGNGIGVSGLAPAVKVMPLKVSASSGPHANDPLSSAIAAAVLQAVAARVDFINLSLEITEETEAVRQALRAALDQGIIVVAAAGNGSGQPVSFPANMPGVIAVANTRDDGSLYVSSNIGPEIALAAPGVAPVSTLLGGGYGVRGSGTSYSSPLVVGALAALRSANPHWSKATLLRTLQGTAKSVPGQAFGSLQAGAAAVALTPDLLPQASSFAGTENLSLSYRLPETDASVDVYVVVDTPAGSYALRPDGGWQPVASGYLPVTANYAAGARRGDLFGGREGFPPLSLSGLPHGSYLWRVALVESGTQTLLGPVVSSAMRLGLP
jgi:subtilisin family serine protease